MQIPSFVPSWSGDYTKKLYYPPIKTLCEGLNGKSFSFKSFLRVFLSNIHVKIALVLMYIFNRKETM